MKEYQKINTVFKRDPNNLKRIIVGEFSCPEFYLLKDCVWVFTEKVDGTNIRVYWDGQKITFGGRTDNASIPANLFQKLADIFMNEISIAQFKESFGESEACLYGEGYGAKIQKGGGNYKPDGVDFVLFDVTVGDWQLQRDGVEDVAKKFGIGVVPIIGKGTLDDMVEITKSGIDSNWGNFKAEGIVARPEVELKNRKGERVITKIKYRDFQ